MKKITVILLTFFLLVSTTLSPFAVTYEPGDANLDKYINISDATYIQKYLVGIVNATDTADFDGNGHISIVDATATQKYIVGIIQLYDGYLYSINGNIGSIIGYNGTDTTLKIPSSINNQSYKITSISDFAFANRTDIKSVVLPKGIIEIGNDSFSNCKNLERVYIKNANCKISATAFNNCTNLSVFSIG